MLELGVKFLIGYFLGSLMGALVVGRLRGGVDIRKMGSGNAGGTNALRTQGIGFALAVVFIDVGKGALAAGVVPGLELPFVAEDPAVSRTWLMMACAAAAVFGHVWPVYHRFRGGKGAATLVGTLAVINAAVLLPVAVVWVTVLTTSGYVGLATMSAAVAAPVWLAITTYPEHQPTLVYCIAMAGFVIFWHRSNIQRMREGAEHRNDKLMLFRRRSSARTGQTGDDEPS